MMRRLAAAPFVLLFVVACAFGAGKEVTGTLVIVDAENKRITIAEKGKHVVYGLNMKELLVTVNDKVSPAGLKDKALIRGVELVLIIPESGKFVNEIVVGPRKTALTDTGQPKDGNRPKPEQRATTATVVKVNLEKMILTVKAEGKTFDLTVGDETKFIGPKGGKRGTGAIGLKDDALKEGAEIQFTPGKDGKPVEEIRLPFRK
jgi:hypothetical protein